MIKLFRKKTCLWTLASLLPLVLPSLPSNAQDKVSPFAQLAMTVRKDNPRDFLLANGKGAAPIYLDANDFPVVQIAADALAADIARVTDQKPSVLTTQPAPGDTAVFIGTVGKSPLIDGLVNQKKLDVSAIRGQWERYVIVTVNDPMPGIRQALVIAGSDRRGTAYGVFGVSESIGVPPLVWWGDVAPEHRDTLVFPQTRYVSKSPSVKYRGIFINDEDWGLLPWAKKLEPEIGSIGPKTYARVGELLLRLKANYLWPAMHEATTAFNQIPQNKLVMDRYAIVMGASHAEPMLFNNATEWKYPKNQWNYETHADLIKGVWEKRVKENGAYENSYTVGIRGIHDSPMAGGGSTKDGVKRLERVIADQRDLLSKYVNPRVNEVPQIFVPYKEVLPFYQAGMKVPDDVTLVWVDDNFGFIRQLSTPDERKRKGSAGVYYHFSYLGPPQDYLWIGSTSPALTAYEMQKAFAYGADRLWVFNVGDIKPIEKELEFAMRLAYDVECYPVDKAMDFLADFVAENFGATYAQETAAILEDYYRLTAQVKPEHNDRMLLGKTERDARSADYSVIVRRAEDLYVRLPAEKKDAFFELVLYPVKGAALMNSKYASWIQGDLEGAIKAHESIKQITSQYNKTIAGGKWDSMMNDNPKNNRVFRRPGGAGTSDRTATPLFQLEPGNAVLTGGMKLVNGAIVATAPDMRTQSDAHAARFVFESPTAREVSVYLLAQTVDDKHDSWFVDLNGQKATVNDNVTGNTIEWIKAIDVHLAAGANTLTIGQREEDTRIYQVAVVEKGRIPKPVNIRSPHPVGRVENAPRTVLAAADYTQVKNAAGSRWTKIKGLGIEKSAMTLLPFLSKPITAVEKAPSITYSFAGDSPKVTVETRFLPTHRVNQDTGLRYAISVDDGPIEIRDVESPAEGAGSWASNVLAGYAQGTTTHTLKRGNNHTITIRFLDPGIVLSQIRVFNR